ncbi:MAG: ATP-dependent helicase [Chloroflexi bacterium]|nr:ATP-dependent helicase [Chloroflexota bacterium]
MPTTKPTNEQLGVIKAIEQGKNCVVIANPGSGKTFTLSQAIKRIIPNLLHYQGVIAISYTNKASDELESRCFNRGVDQKSSYFGTIDKFFLTEFIFPFGRHVFGEPTKDSEIIELNEILNTDDQQIIGELLDRAENQKDHEELYGILENHFLDGNVILESIGCLASHIFDNSSACRRYLLSRFTHIFIDEYQDCGYWQDVIFNQLVKLGIKAVAVGDVNQSIFQFANKYPEHLIAISNNTKLFSTFTLTRNHRSHLSIIDYSARLLSSTYEPQSGGEYRVFHKHIEGSEIEIAQWLSISIPFLQEKYQVSRNDIGILVRTRRTGNLIHRNLDIPHKPIVTTPLDQDSSLWGGVFRKIMNWILYTEITKYDLVEENLNLDLQKKEAKEAMSMLRSIERVSEKNPSLLIENINLFTRISEIFYPNRISETAIEKLNTVLTEPLFLESYMPPRENEIQLLTLHKAKGLEFSIVFHLDLHKYIMPMYHGDELQDLNLHYVGITRAKDCCVLCTSTQRHNNQGLRGAETSEFMVMNELESLANECPV